MPRQVDHAARRRDIGAAVLKIAAERGFREATIRAVAAAVGASTSQVTHYVSSRDELIRIAVRHEIEARRVQITELLADSERPLRALVEWAVLGTGAEAQRIWLAIVLGAPTEPVVRAELEEFNRWWDGVVRHLVGSPCDADVVDVLVGGLVFTGFEASEDWSRERRLQVVDAVLAPLGL
ncbi:TetR/AcrR family transcriptional regulator [Streptomyces flavofungini]|uniref:TetR/AcrR family transcriptional regulator n=1 Tax=Streptomyces flavofungini TaxID=68200 RepID=UPI0025B1C4D7|nr:TetR/AcrR family transcriptional regulator [Streptomyces flavofungini]WJV51006.1 TetR/AcrR family transcriptional regulator [Streptomyces flavofungini]